MNGLRERRKKRPRLRKMMEKREKSKKKKKRRLFTGLDLYLRAKMKKKTTWVILKHCDGSSIWNCRQNGFGRPIPCSRPILTMVRVDQFLRQFQTAVRKKKKKHIVTAVLTTIIIIIKRKRKRKCRHNKKKKSL